ncbi:MAG: hypothetical protein AAGF12_31765, partial [Myxococcota bacterium]
MAKDTKFGVFGGVFTPSILTILGVIMYLRLPWVVGNAGLYSALGIIAVAHLVSVSTGLSISSIATDKKVGAGGPYYIVSRSLGLPIGGTLGLALFLGLSFSISLYVIGFSESFLATIGVEPTAAAIRICGTITLVLLTVVTFISTALAIKTQYLILGLIVLSLLSIGAGLFGVESAEAVLEPASDADAPSLATLFGVFFPAVTGFTAGVNMSGDLRDPKRAIPQGTMMAIFVGAIVYIGLAIALALFVSREALRTDSELLLTISAVPSAVVAGIWGATISSALGSILGAPRILQAISVDRITPKFFGKGYGKANEPRHALMLACGIGEAGILIAELDVIAAIVSMVFLTTYGVLNLSCAIESSVSPDFRPSFRIPRTVSLLGAGACLLLMIQLNIVAMFGATALMAVLFVYLQRRQLTLEAGDAWEGVWSNLVRTGLYRLRNQEHHQRNWKPNILLFAEPDSEGPGPARRLARELVAGAGLLTDFALIPRVADRPAAKHTSDDSRSPSEAAKPKQPAEADSSEDESEEETIGEPEEESNEESTKPKADDDKTTDQESTAKQASAPKKLTAKGAAAGKTAAKKTAAKKTAAKKTAAKKTGTKKTAAKKTAAKKTAAKKTG